MSEREIKHAIRLALGADPRVVLWVNSTGHATEWSQRGGERHIRYGLCVGSADLIGVLAPSGRFLALETKTPTGRLTVEQRQFLTLVRRMGGFGACVRSVDDAKAAIERACAGGVE